MLLILLVLIFCFDFWFWYEYETRPQRGSPLISNQSVSTTQSGELTKFGRPVAHQLIGPYHVLTNEGYVSGYDSGIQDPRWVETRSFSVTDPKSAARPEQFSPDERIEPQFRVTTDFWRDTGYDRGHMAPNWGVSICYGRSAQVESFLLTNVVPQTPELNRGLWETLEKIISNDYAERFGQVWVICDPEFPAHPAMLHGDSVEIPDRCFKIVLRVDHDGTPRALAFEIPQNVGMGHRQSDLLQYLVPISEIEKQTGLEFFPELAPSFRSRLEAVRENRLW